MERVGHARVRLENIEANPWRRLDSYPIDEKKVEQLKSSIERTEFWDNLVMREHPDGRRKGIYQISYGHHRMEALRQLYEPTHEIGVIVRQLSDAKMLQIMAAENDDVYDLSVAVIFETVIAARDFLIGHREEMLPDVELDLRFPIAGHVRLTPEERHLRNKGTTAMGGGVGPPPEWVIGEPTHVFRNNYTREVMQVAIFLDWPISRCREALMMAKDPNSKLLVGFRNMRVAEEFKRQTRRFTDLESDTLARIAWDVKDQDMGTREVRRTFESYAILEGDFGQRQASKVITMSQVMRRASKKIRAAMSVITELTDIRTRFGDNVYTEALEEAEFGLALEELIEALQELKESQTREETDYGAEIEGEIVA